MNYSDALPMAESILESLRGTCTQSSIVGSVRRREPEVHDIELLLQPILGAVPPKFGDPVTHAHALDQALYGLTQTGVLKLVMGGPKMRRYEINLDAFSYPYEMLNPFHLECYIMTPPAQFGVGMVIRTGPGRPTDNFSKHCVTNRTNYPGSNGQGGLLPDGHKVSGLAVWKDSQGAYKSGRFVPRDGESPIEMPQEEDFLAFLGLRKIAPWGRHAPSGRW